jgi:hypothetical protein
MAALVLVGNFCTYFACVGRTPKVLRTNKSVFVQRRTRIARVWGLEYSLLLRHLSQPNHQTGNCWETRRSRRDKSNQADYFSATSGALPNTLSLCAGKPQARVWNTSCCGREGESEIIHSKNRTEIMKTARLVKKQELKQPLDSCGLRLASPVSRVNNKDTVQQWINEHQQTRYTNPRTAFAALFGEVL